MYLEKRIYMQQLVHVQLFPGLQKEELNETIVYLMRAAIAVYNLVMQQIFTNMNLHQARLHYHLIKKC